MSDRTEILKRLAQLADELDLSGEPAMADQIETKMAKPSLKKPGRLSAGEKHRLNQMPVLAELNQGSHDDNTTNALWHRVMEEAEKMGVIISGAEVPLGSDSYETNLRYEHVLLDAATQQRIENAIFLRNLYVKDTPMGDRVEFNGYFA